MAGQRPPGTIPGGPASTTGRADKGGPVSSAPGRRRCTCGARRFVTRPAPWTTNGAEVCGGSLGSGVECGTTRATWATWFRAPRRGRSRPPSPTSAPMNEQDEQLIRLHPEGMSVPDGRGGRPGARRRGELEGKRLRSRGHRRTSRADPKRAPAARADYGWAVEGGASAVAAVAHHLLRLSSATSPPGGGLEEGRVGRNTDDRDLLLRQPERRGRQAATTRSIAGEMKTSQNRLRASP